MKTTIRHRCFFAFGSLESGDAKTFEDALRVAELDYTVETTASGSVVIAVNCTLEQNERLIQLEASLSSRGFARSRDHATVVSVYSMASSALRDVLCQGPEIRDHQRQTLLDRIKEWDATINGIKG